MAPEVNIPISNYARYNIINSLFRNSNLMGVAQVEKNSKKGSIKAQGLPPGTRSIITYYKLLDGWLVIKTHHYELPGGEKRGGPDLLYIVVDDVVFSREPKTS